MVFRRHEAKDVDERLDIIIDLLLDILIELRPRPTATIVFKGPDMTAPASPTPGPITIDDNQSVAAGIALSDNPNNLTVTDVEWSVSSSDITSTPGSPDTTTVIAGVPGSDGTTTLSAVITLSDGSTVDASTTVTTQAPVVVAPPIAQIVFGTPTTA
jgi:hypothetical protein